MHLSKTWCFLGDLHISAQKPLSYLLAIHNPVKPGLKGVNFWSEMAQRLDKDEPFKCAYVKQSVFAHTIIWCILRKALSEFTVLIIE